MTGIFASTSEMLQSMSTLTGLPGYFIKASLLVVLALALRPILKNATPSIRSLVLRAGVASLFLLTAATIVVPGLQVPYPSFVGALFLNSPTVQASATASAWPGGAVPWSVILFSIWVLGICLFGLKYVAGILTMRRIERSSSPCLDESVVLATRRIASDLGIRPAVTCMITDKVAMPMAWRTLRPVVIIPIAMLNEPSSLAMVIRHELAHIRRNDILWLNLTSLLTIIHWFNPLVWIMRRQLLKEAELACDDFVLISGISPQEYASHLIESARLSKRRRTAVAISTAYTTQMEGRIMSILANRTRSAFTNKRSAILVLLLAALLAIPMSIVTFQIGQAANDNAGKPKVTSSETSDDSIPSPNDFIAVDSMPVMTYEAPVVYPEEAKKAGIEGDVMVRAFVNKKGIPSKVTVLKSSGDARLDQAALDSAVKNKYSAALLDGNPVGVWIAYKVSFKLADKKAPK